MLSPPKQYQFGWGSLRHTLIWINRSRGVLLEPAALGRFDSFDP